MSKKAVETDLFRKVNISLTDKNKKELDFIKEKTTLLSDIHIDNSTLVRAMIMYFYEHDKQLSKLTPYIQKTKGHHLLHEVNQMMDRNSSFKEIEDKLGISVAILEKATSKKKM